MRRRIIGLVVVLVVVMALAAVSLALLTRSDAQGDANLLATIDALETEVAERDIDLAATAEAILGGYAPPFTETWRVDAVRQYPARPQLRTGKSTGLYDDMEYTDHQAAGQFVVFELELTNISKEARDSPVPADTFAVIDPTGRTYTADLDISWKLRNAEHLGPDFDTYQPDTSGSEIVVFDVPKDVEPAQLASKDGSWSVALIGPTMQGTPVADPVVP
jgi:hypothetical protein